MSTMICNEDEKTETPHINGTDEPKLTPDLLFKLNKKIAQLTKVVYSLNTRGEELESELVASKENEEKAKALNTDLQFRVNNFKSRIETEMAKLKDIESQAAQAQYWKMEYENVKRRLEAEPVPRDVQLDIIVDELEQSRLREQSVQYELEQAKHSINNLKTHQELILRERDAIIDKVVIEWQVKLSDAETRHTTQLRRVSEELENVSEECSNLRVRIQNNSDDSSLKEQINTLKLSLDKEKKNHLHELRQKSEEAERERGEIIELQRKLHIANDEKRKLEDKWDEEIHNVSKKFEDRITELQNKCDILQELEDNRDQEFEIKLKSKLQEWRTDRDTVEEGYRTELRNLRDENDQLDAEIKLLRTHQKPTSQDSSKLQQLQQEISEKSREMELKCKNYNVRINMLETKNKQITQEKREYEVKLKEDADRHKELMGEQESLHLARINELSHRLATSEDVEKSLRELNLNFEARVQRMSSENNELSQRIKDLKKDLEMRIEREKAAAEAKLKVDKTWQERMQISEELAMQELQNTKEEYKKREDTLKKKMDGIEQMKEEAKRTNEELRKKIREMRQQEMDASKRQSTTDSQLNNLKRQDDLSSRKIKELESQGTRYQQQVDQLSAKLTNEQEKTFQLRQDLDDAQKSVRQLKTELTEAKKTSSAATSLEIKIQDLSRSIREKDAINESVRVDLQYTKNDNELSKSKIKRLEEEAKSSMETIRKLENQLSTKSSDHSRVNELEEIIRQLTDKLEQSESTRRNAEKTLEEIEEEREEEVKIVQDALDEAAQEREELIQTFKKELDLINSKNTDREQQLLEDFEWKLREMQKENKKKMDDSEHQAENTLHRRKHSEDDDKNKLEKLRKDLNSEWESRLENETSRLKIQLESKYEAEKYAELQSQRDENKKDIDNIRRTLENEHKETQNELSNLKHLLTEKEGNHQRELESMRTNCDRDMCDLRLKLQKLSDSSYDKEQKMIETHSEELERLRIDYDERIKEMNSRLVEYESRIGIDAIAKINEDHRLQLSHLEEQHRLSMERLREESEADKFQCVEEARIALTNNYESVAESLREELSEERVSSTQYKNECEMMALLVAKRDDTIKSLEDQIDRQKNLHLDASVTFDCNDLSTSGISCSQYSLESSNESQESTTSQGSISDSGNEESHKNNDEQEDVLEDDDSSDN